MTEPTIVICPYCQQPFKSNGVNRHISKLHKGMPHFGKDLPNSSSEAPICQSEPISGETPIPAPIIGDEALRANQNPMNEPAEIPANQVEDEECEDLEEDSAVSDNASANDSPTLVEAMAPAVCQAALEAFEEVTKKLADPPIPTPPQKVISQIPIGSEIMLHGDVYWQNPKSFDWEVVKADHLQVLVVGLETVDNVVHLMCKASGGIALWSVLQSDVLEGKYRVLRLAQAPATTPTPPPKGKREFIDACAKAREEFLPVLNTYLEAKERVEVAEKMFAEVHEANYQEIENYVLNFGEQICDDPQTVVAEEDGVRIKLVEVEGLSFEKISTEA